MKNKIAVRLMEAGVSYNKQKLHKAGYFRELLASKPTSTMGGGPCCVCAAKWWFGEKDRERFGAVSGTSRIAAGTNRAAHDHPGGWPDHGADLGIGGWRVRRFSSIKKAINYCGLCGAEKRSADTIQRTPLSKQRNKHLQTILIEAAKLAPRNSPALAMLYL
jgi:transposase